MGYERLAAGTEAIREQLHRETVAIANMLDVFNRVSATVKLAIEFKVRLRDPV